jgi:hypothetical protein
MAAKDNLGRQWNSGREVMSRQLDNLFNLDDPEDNYELAGYGDKGMLPDYEGKSGWTDRGSTGIVGSRGNLPERAPDPNRGKFGRNNEPRPPFGSVVVDRIHAELERQLGSTWPRSGQD